MAKRDFKPEEAITEEEMGGDERQRKRSRTAFEVMMAPRPQPQPQPQPQAGPASHQYGYPFGGRMALGQYLGHPASFPSSVVIYHTEDFVIIQDKYPKATIHTLLLPRSAKHNLLHPFDAFEDAEFLAKVKEETAKVKALVAKELRRRFGRYSKADAAREAILNGDAEPQPQTNPEIGGGGCEEEEEEEQTDQAMLPAGRDWDAEVISGIHAVPSMSHLHVHVLSRDMRSPKAVRRSHYNSFTTPFLVGLDEFPLAASDPRRNTWLNPYLKWDMRCWRCGQNFGNQFQKLKEHLEKEFDEWKRL